MFCQLVGQSWDRFGDICRPGARQNDLKTAESAPKSAISGAQRQAYLPGQQAYLPGHQAELPGHSKTSSKATASQQQRHWKSESGNMIFLS